MIRLFIVCLLVFNSVHLSAQLIPNFRSPLDIPLFLSGNFGELRNDHFHSGIDIKTMGTTGHPVFAIEDGYVSRIKVQSGGYGQAIYIDHHSGYTSVYGHLKGYNDEITQYVREQQYAKKSFEVDLYPGQGKLKVTRGDTLGYSGNTGSSSGPHLHFEIRNTANQSPTNVLQYNFPIMDNIPPVISLLAIYPVGENATIGNGTEPLYIRPGKNSHLPGNPFLVSGKIGVGIQVFDYLDGVRNRCGVFTIEMFLDGKLVFRSEMDRFLFSESRYINAHIDYRMKVEKGLSIQRLFQLPHNNLSIYSDLSDRGLIEVRDAATHVIEIVVTDTYGNFSEIAFELKGTAGNNMQRKTSSGAFRIFPYNTGGGFRDRDVTLEFEPYTFYDKIEFNYARTAGNDRLLSDVFHLHDPGDPVHKHMTLSISPGKFPEGKEKHLCIVRVQEDGELISAGGEFEDGMLRTQIRSFGRYAVAIDTVPPLIIPLNLAPGKKMEGTPGIRFAVTDELSGIKRYNAYIDNQWALLKYDPKNDLMVYEFDQDRLSHGKLHELEIYIEDSAGNTSIYHTTFEW